jgi:hypothetical protein
LEEYESGKYIPIKLTAEFAKPRYLRFFEKFEEAWNLETVHGERIRETFHGMARLGV